MGQKVTIGGDRLGAGKKMQTELHNYGMSSHNLSTRFRSTLSAGVLYPSLVLIGERDDHFKINLEQDIRTQPTIAPLFGSFKLQTDFFMCPFRLYQGLLHNNPIDLGRVMNQVKLPKVVVETSKSTSAGRNAIDGKLNDSSLMAYCGMRGLGTNTLGQSKIEREIFAIPQLAYYDIFKNYYANKQEEKAYAISAIDGIYDTQTTSAYRTIDSETTEIPLIKVENKFEGYINWASDVIGVTYENFHIKFKYDISNIDTDLLKDNIALSLYADNVYNIKSISEWEDSQIIVGFEYVNEKEIAFSVDMQGLAMEFSSFGTDETKTTITIPTTIIVNDTNDISIVPFELKNIDQMRYDVLKHQELGVSFKITKENAYLPYSLLTGTDEQGKTFNKRVMNGLVLKTYQNDIFNAWVNSECIDGENGVAELSKIVVDSDGAFTIDALTFARKIYNLYNRINLSGATYYEWQNVVWSESKMTHVESPVYVGGYASEVMFEEIVQSAPTSIDGDAQPLGTLAGKGRLIGKKGGYIEIDCDEACVILAITSLTPRISYTQGNEWYMTELDSIDDLHKPEFDGIGFQDLLGERLAWFDAFYNPALHKWERTKVGKLPAWIEYQTNYDRTFGDFTDKNKAGYMVLTRDYEFYNDNAGHAGIKDVTTYIDPTKYNYAFAVTDIDAQNFWLEAQYNIEKRMRGSAHLIPQA